MIGLWSRLTGYVAVAGAAVGAVLLAIAKVKSDTREEVENEHAARDAGDQRKTTDAYIGAGGDPATQRKRLRDRTQQW